MSESYRKNPKICFFRVLSTIGSAASWILLVLAALWAIGALWYDLPVASARRWIAIAFGILAIALCVLLRPVRRAKLILAMAVVLIMIWWFNIQPRQFRNWKPEVAELPRAVIEGDRVTLFSVRNFEYRTEHDFTARYETRQIHLKNLRGVDVFMNYWGSPYMSHPLVSYDFGDEGRICFSIETRPEKGETYSAIGGLYRQFELTYIVADERDVIRLRTNFRKGEDVYLYRLNAPLLRDSFMEYVRAINELHATPRWYNAITNNCTTAIRHQRAADRRSPWDWRMLVNGFADELLYERKGISTSLPFVELKEKSRITERAKAAGDSPDFSEKIREGLPGM